MYTHKCAHKHAHTNDNTHSQARELGVKASTRAKTRPDHISNEARMLSKKSEAEKSAGIAECFKTPGLHADPAFEQLFRREFRRRPPREQRSGAMS